MKPKVSERRDWIGFGDRVVGIMPVTSPHNEKPAAKFQLRYLKKVAGLLDELGTREGYLWVMDGPRDSGTSLAFTEDRDSRVAVCLAGMTFDD